MSSDHANEPTRAWSGYPSPEAYFDDLAVMAGDPVADVRATLAQVKRDAARDALDGLADFIDERASFFLSPTGRSGKAQDVLDYRDTFYPEETP